MSTVKVSEMTVDDLSVMIASAVDNAPKTFFTDEVKRIIAEQNKNFYVPAEQHYNQHKMLEQCTEQHEEWKLNHDFVSGMRNKGQRAWNIGFSLAVVSVCGGFFAIISEGFRGFLLGIIK